MKYLFFAVTLAAVLLCSSDAFAQYVVNRTTGVFGDKTTKLTDTRTGDYLSVNQSADVFGRKTTTFSNARGGAVSIRDTTNQTGGQWVAEKAVDAVLERGEREMERERAEERERAGKLQTARDSLPETVRIVGETWNSLDETAKKKVVVAGAATGAAAVIGYVLWRWFNN
jgi:hypothetical protein